MTDFSGLEVSHYIKSKEQILQTLPSTLVWRKLPERPIETLPVLAVFMKKSGTVFWKRSSWKTTPGGKIVWYGLDSGWDMPEPIAWAHIRINEFTTTEEKTT